MSVCAHDPYCPGYGEAHEKSLSVPRHEWETFGQVFGTPASLQTVTNPDKDRTLSGKKRKKARRH